MVAEILLMCRLFSDDDGWMSDLQKTKHMSGQMCLDGRFVFVKGSVRSDVSRWLILFLIKEVSGQMCLDG